MHLIQQHTFDIQCTSGDFGKEVQNQLSMLLEKDFYPKLDLLLDKYALHKHTWNIDELNIKLPEISKKHWKSELVEKGLFQIEEYLKRNNFSNQEKKDSAEHPNHFISMTNHAENLFYIFLKTGRIIENTISKNLEKIISEIEINDNFIQKLIEILKSDNRFLIRWIFSIPDSFKKDVIKKVSGFSNELGIDIHTFFENYKDKIKVINPILEKLKTNGDLKSHWIELMLWLDYFHKENVSKENISKVFIELSDKYWGISPQELKFLPQFILDFNNVQDSKLLTNESKQFFELLRKNGSSYNKSTEKLRFPEVKNDLEINENKTILDTAQYINNAGLVILHPFLKTLFEQLKLCKSNGAWKNEMSQHKAVLLTQYLVMQDEKIQESDLVLNKILCGFPIDNVVNVKLKFSKIEKEKCKKLLEAVKEHWKDMRGSSVEALQQTFLQRDGKLELNNKNEFELLVEEKGVDILLEKLPWGIGTIKTPWMDNYLNCHWNQ